MSYIIDRRLNSKNKSAVNRQRFLERYRQHIKRAVSDAVDRRSITDMERGEEVSIPARDISEPVFHHGRGGRQSGVHPGNKEFVEGDRIARPGGSGGGGGGGVEAVVKPPTPVKASTTSCSRSAATSSSTICSTTSSCRT